LAIGNLWSWLIPLVWGWYAVGCHHGRRDPVDKKIYESLESIRLPNGSTANPQYDSPPLSIRTPSGYVNKKHPTILGIPVCGDELKCGPFYNYARCGTWSHVSQIVIGAYSATFSTRPIRVPASAVTGAPILDAQFTPTLRRCGLRNRETLSSFGWLDPTVAGNGSSARAARAFCYAFVLHGTAGWSAFMIAYNTPTVGLGCRSLVYMIYVVTSIFSCLLLIISSVCFDHWSWRSEKGIHGGTVNLGLAMGTLFTRFLGKTLALLNALLVLTSCVLQFLGVYNSCRCKSSQFGLHERAYIVFLSQEELAEHAIVYWGTAAAITMFSVGFVCFGYFEPSRRDLKKYSRS
jgi:hypothetical protein